MNNGPVIVSSAIPAKQCNFFLRGKLLFDKTQPVKERIFEVSFVYDETALQDADADNDEVTDNSTEGSKNISLTYWSDQIDKNGIKPIIISGVYEDNSTNLYYLMVPLAVSGDIALTAAYLTLCIMTYGAACR